MKTEPICPDGIRISEHHRPVDPATVARLAESMKAIGQLQPIIVYWRQGEGVDEVHLIAGRHRVEAALALEWDFIDAVFVTEDEIDCRLIEISENLHRAELTV